MANTMHYHKDHEGCVAFLHVSQLQSNMGGFNCSVLRMIDSALE